MTFDGFVLKIQANPDEKCLFSGFCLFFQGTCYVGKLPSTEDTLILNLAIQFFLWPHQIVWRTRFPQKNPYSRILFCWEKIHKQIQIATMKKHQKCLISLICISFSWFCLYLPAIRMPQYSNWAHKTSPDSTCCILFFLWPHQIVWRTPSQKIGSIWWFYFLDKKFTTNFKFSIWNSLEIHAPWLWASVGTFYTKNPFKSWYKTIENPWFFTFVTALKKKIFRLGIGIWKFQNILGKVQDEISAFPESFPCCRNFSIQLSGAQDLSFREFSVLAMWDTLTHLGRDQNFWHILKNYMTQFLTHKF